MSLICRKLIKVGTGPSSYWDVAGGHGKNSYLTGDDAIAQAVSCELQLILGEWFLDVSRGIPWIAQPNASATPILGQFPANLPYAESVLKAAILSVPGVTNLLAFSLTLDHNTRSATCNAKAMTENGGTIPISERV